MNAQTRITKPMETRIMEAFRRKGAWIELTSDDLCHRIGAVGYVEKQKAVKTMQDLAYRGMLRAQMVCHVSVWSATAKAREAVQ